jgi:hypothetical protein
MLVSEYCCTWIRGCHIFYLVIKSIAAATSVFFFLKTLKKKKKKFAHVTRMVVVTRKVVTASHGEKHITVCISN